MYLMIFSVKLYWKPRTSNFANKAVTEIDFIFFQDLVHVCNANRNESKR